MTPDSIGVAVIGGGMAGRAHAAAYRTASTLFDLDRPEVRLVAVADPNRAAAADTARRYGYARAEESWEAIAAAADIGAVSIATANHLHREMTEGLLAAGKHVLCEKPLAGSCADARAMTRAADASDRVTAVGYTYRRSPAISAVGQAIADGGLGDVIQFSGRFWEDYALNPRTPLTWRYQGGPGSGALADLGTHLIDIAEQLCGPMTEVSGARLATVIAERPIPAGSTVGHELAGDAGQYGRVGNEDVAAFTARFASGALGTFSISRVAHSQLAGLGFEIFGTGGSAAFDFHQTGEFSLSGTGPGAPARARRRVLIGPDHPYIRDGLPMDVGGVGHGLADMFAYQARAFLDQISGIPGLPPCADFRTGVRGLSFLAAITESARGGTAVKTA